MMSVKCVFQASIGYEEKMDVVLDEESD